MPQHSTESPICKLITICKYITYCYRTFESITVRAWPGARQILVFAADCPSRANLCLLGNKWCLLVLRALAGNTLRFTDLHRRVGAFRKRCSPRPSAASRPRGSFVRRVYPEIPSASSMRSRAMRRPWRGRLKRFADGGARGLISQTRLAKRLVWD